MLVFVNSQVLQALVGNGGSAQVGLRSSVCLPTSLSIHQNQQKVPQSLELIAGKDQSDLCAPPSAVSTCKDSLEAGRWTWKVRKGVPDCEKQDATVLSGACHLLSQVSLWGLSALGQAQCWNIQERWQPSPVGLQARQGHP